MRCIEENYTKNSSLFITSIRELLISRSLYETNEYRQRDYLFDDVPGADGDKWQRELFADTFMDCALLPIIIEKNTNPKLPDTIEDGQQRYNTLVAISKGCVRLPSDMGKYGSQYKHLSNRSLPELAKLETELYENFLDKKVLLLVCEDTPEERKSKNFIGWNNGTPLTKQEKRGAQYSHGSHYLHNLTKTLKISTIETRKNKRKFSFLKDNFPVTGKTLEEIIAFWYDSHLAGKIQSMNQSSLERRYKQFQVDGIKTPSNIAKSNKNFEKRVSLVDNSVFTYVNLSKKNRDFFGKRQVRFFFSVIQTLLNNKYKVDQKTIARDYEVALAKLSEENHLWTDPKKFTKKTNKPVQIFWDDLFNKRADEAHQIEYVVNKIVETIVSGNKNYVKRDTRRSFTRKQKLLGHTQQDGNCFYCGEPVEFSQAVGDHKIAHSKGGKTELENCRIVCPKCNEEKGSNSEHEHITVLELRRKEKSEPAEA